MPRHARKEGLSRRHRFAERGSFAPALRGARKIRGTLAVLHVIPAPGGYSRLGIALTRRLVATALDRNRVKRIAREIFRRHPVKAAGFECVFTLRGKYEAAQAAALRAEMASLLDRVIPAGEAAA